jgi:hypothetical protein
MMAKGAEFTARYRAKHGRDPQLFAAYAYDATTVLADALMRAGSTSSHALLHAVARTNHRGVTGVIAFASAGNIEAGAVAVYSVRQGRWQVAHVGTASASLFDSSNKVTTAQPALPPSALHTTPQAGTTTFQIFSDSASGALHYLAPNTIVRRGNEVSVVTLTDTESSVVQGKSVRSTLRVDMVDCATRELRHANQSFWSDKNASGILQERVDVQSVAQLIPARSVADTLHTILCHPSIEVESFLMKDAQWALDRKPFPIVPVVSVVLDGKLFLH